ncbi:glycosyltransferase family 4 protein [Fusobacterium sp.]|uniref:glycosyltransferase family 4 protein n=1 Tax=Fusobacterium sp. TaxID=68766 RepID=UPI000C703420|nr:glycosyltransferase family 4 protein [Fusobacterium sp.]
MKKNFLHIHDEFEYTWLGKDNGMIPIYMSEVCGYNSYILTNDIKHELPDVFRSVHIVKVKRLFKKIGNFAYFIKLLRRLNIFKYLIKNAKEIDVLMLFHISRCSYWYAFVYKLLNKTGKVYIKADFNLEVYQKEIRRLNTKSRTFKDFFKKRNEIAEYKKRKKLVTMVDLISYETEDSYNEMKYSYAGVDTKGKVIYLPNGYDNLEIERNYKIKNMDNKKNIILTVGRLGTEAKNTEFLLESLKKIDFKDWKFYFVGSETKEFQIYKDNFFNKYPYLKEKILFLGEIKDRKKLYSLYNEAKVFVLSSKWESFGIVMVEAMAFGEYIITSNTCAANDITKNGEIGKIISIDEDKELVNSIQDVINNKIDLKLKYGQTLEYVKKFRYENIIKNLNEGLK